MSYALTVHVVYHCVSYFETLRDSILIDDVLGRDDVVHDYYWNLVLTSIVVAWRKAHKFEKSTSICHG